MSQITWNDQQLGFFIDMRDQQKYKVVKIGNQIWMAENLRFKTTDLMKKTLFGLINKSVGATSWVHQNNDNYLPEFGWLYSDAGCYDAAPEGWKIPSNQDWKILATFLKGFGNAGFKLKSNAGNHWKKEDPNATNEFLFSALPGGYVNFSQYGTIYFEEFGQSANFWAIDEESEEYLVYSIQTDDNELFESEPFHRFAYSIRCIFNEK